MEDSEDSLPTLLCKEDTPCFNEQYREKNENLDICSVSDTDSDYIEVLIQKEAIFQSNRERRSSTSGGTWLQCARADAIKWMLDTRALFGFRFRTAYLSLVYFDRFLERRSIDDGKLWAIRLLSVACLSLAAKMEECELPGLSEYRIPEYNFEGGTIQRMELLVLGALEWKMTCPTPFAYLNYFIKKFCGEFSGKELINRVVELIVALMAEINVMEHRPSIIAAAAVLAAYDCKLTKRLFEIKTDAVPLLGSLEKEHIFSCYTLVQELGMLKSKTPKSIISPSSLSSYSSSIDVVRDSTTVASNTGSKRRLTYTDGDQHKED